MPTTIDPAAPPRSETEKVIEGIIETVAPIGVTASGIGAPFALAVPGIIQWAFREYDLIAQQRAAAGQPVVHDEIAALVMERAIAFDPADEIRQAEKAAGVPVTQ